MKKVKTNKAWNGGVLWQVVQTPEQSKGSCNLVVELDSWPVVVTEGALVLNERHPKVAAALRAAEEAGTVDAFKRKAEEVVVSEIEMLTSIGEMRFADGSWNFFYASGTASHTMLGLIDEMGLGEARQAA